VIVENAFRQAIPSLLLVAAVVASLAAAIGPPAGAWTLLWAVGRL
jgi:hypothetical protein